MKQKSPPPKKIHMFPNSLAIGITCMQLNYPVHHCDVFKLCNLSKLNYNHYPIVVQNELSKCVKMIIKFLAYCKKKIIRYCGDLEVSLK